MKSPATAAVLSLSVLLALTGCGSDPRDEYADKVNARVKSSFSDERLGSWGPSICLQLDQGASTDEIEDSIAVRSNSIEAEIMVEEAIDFPCDKFDY